MASKGLRPDAYYARFRLMRKNDILTEHVERFVVTQPPSNDGIRVSLWPDNAVGDAFAAGNGAAFLNYFNSLGFNEHCIYWGAQGKCAHTATEAKNMLRDIFDTALEQGIVLGVTSGTFSTTTNVTEAYVASGEKLPANAVASQFTPQRIEQTKKTADEILAAIGQFPAFQRLFINTEAEDSLGMDRNPAARERIEAALGFKLTEPLGETKYIAEGVIAADDKKLHYERVRWKLGDGWVFGNATLAQDIRTGRPDVRAWSDPFRNCMVMGRFDGLNEASTWTYCNPDLKVMTSAVETLFAEARGTKLGVRQSITFYNYAGTIAPAEDCWDPDKTFCIEADRATIIGWLLLARRVDTLSYYYSSSFNPFMFRGYPLTEWEKLQFSPATSAAIGRFNTEIIRPLGPLVKSLERPKRAAAVLSSFSSVVYRKSPNLNGHYPTEQISHFYSLLAMNNIPADVVFDEQIEQGCLKDYSALFLPKCDTLTETCWKNILEFKKAGGLVVADQYLRADIPGAVRVDYDFTYRDRVNANALNLKMNFTEKDDLATRKKREKEKVEAGVDAQEDQRRMEQYAAQLRSAIGAKMDALTDFGADTPTALCHLLRKGQTEYLFVVNDKRT
ncbi:MAG: beta-galactosidase trimerization domain-containing protein, partial [Kiritimatiellia bacterium]|nr:beta-galactosidase trimerization domain-containing protein [Kiritimatiellia bacterium]